MGQAVRISVSALLITSLGCGGLPEQVQRNAPLDVAASQTFDLSLGFSATGKAPWMFDEHGEPMSAMEAESDLVEETDLPAHEMQNGTESDGDASTPRMLRLFDLNERIPFEIAVTAEGRIADEDRARLEYFFRCRRTEQTHAMAEGVLKILYAIDRKYKGRVIEIVSGYRTFPFGVRDSKHYEGHAIDLRVRGIRTSRVRDFVWSHFADVGVGHYEHQNFVHVDYRPEDKDAAWTSVAPNSEYAYNPHWALRLRAPWGAPRAL